MNSDFSRENGPPLPLSCLRLLVPPIRLVSAAIWQTVKEKVVANYGMIEEFVSIVTDAVPELLSCRQKSQLVLGLRARLILDLCRLEATSEIIKPHLDRMQTLTASCAIEGAAENEELPTSKFTALVQTLLTDHTKRQDFFQNAFPDDFGPMFDESLCTLMWNLLSRLEKLIPLQSLQQVATMLCGVPSVLEECMESVSSCQELKTLLQYQQDLNHLSDDCSFDGACIFSGLNFSYVDRMWPVNEKPLSEAHTLYNIISCTTEMEREAETLENIAHTKMVTTVEKKSRDMICIPTNYGKNQPSVEAKLDENVGLSQVHIEGMIQKECSVLLRRHDTLMSLQSRPVRQNRGMKMNMFLLQEKRGICEKDSPGRETLSPLQTSIQIGTLLSSYVAPLNSSSELDSLSNCSDEDPSFRAPSEVSSSSEFDSRTNCPDEDPSFRAPSEDEDLSDDGKSASAKKTHVVGKGKRCCICKAYVKSYIQKHMLMHFPNNDYTCPRCGEKYQRWSSLRHHLQVHCYQQTEDAHCFYKCNECTKTFRYKLSLDQHKRTHNPLYCEMCRKVLRDAETLARHKVSHTAFQCTLCEESYRQFKPIVNHYKNVHKLTEPFKCNHCAKSFTKLRFYIRHEWRHLGLLPFQCPQCSMKFKVYADLSSHMRVHTKEKPFVCPDCGRAFRYSCNLARHRKVLPCKSQKVRQHPSQKSLSESQTSGKKSISPLVSTPTSAIPHVSDDEHFSDLAPVGTSSEVTCSKSMNEDPNFRAPSEGVDLSAGNKVGNASCVTSASTEKSHVIPRRRRCCICKEYVKTHMKMHMLVHFPNGDYTCPRCGAKFKVLSSLRLHLKRACYDQQLVDPEQAQGEQCIYKCSECEMAFRYKLSLDQHKRTHNPLYCEMCRKVLRDSETLERHRVSHTPFQCTLCEENFPEFKPLVKHYNNVHNLTEPFRCNHCPKSFTKLRFYIRHEWRHLGQLPFQCPQCSMKFKVDADLGAHMRVHTQEKPFLCTDCGKTFSLSCNLARHWKFLHSQSRNEKLHSCSQCEKSFKEKGALKKHQRSKHYNELFRFPCPYCGKLYSTSAMKRHKMIHTGEKPYKCEEPDCDKSFREPRELKFHTIQKHTGERPHKCDVCGRGFSRFGLLSQHMKTHSRKKTHVCLVCGKAFSSQYSMKRHKKLIHSYV